MILTNILAVIGGFALYTLIWMAVIKIIEKYDSPTCVFEYILFYIFFPVTITLFILFIIIAIVLGLTYPFWKTYQLSQRINKLEKRIKSKGSKK
jgi:uncharacterized membrane protein